MVSFTLKYELPDDSHQLAQWLKLQEHIGEIEETCHQIRSHLKHGDPETPIFRDRSQELLELAYGLLWVLSFPED